MRKWSINVSRMSASGAIRLLMISVLVSTFCLTCKSSDGTLITVPPIYSPYRPTIESFTAQRNGTAVEDDIVYAGEDISLVVSATSHAWPQSCGLDEGDTVDGNLVYTFTSYPPPNVDAPGLISQASPPENIATWRIPNLDAHDTGEGLLYSLQVVVLDECLDQLTTGTISLRAFANQGPPAITNTLVQSWVGSATPTTEVLDQNGLYEIERGDECNITITAAARSSSQVCANRGVEDGEELTYVWTSSTSAINLTFNQDPTIASVADFDIPITLAAGQTFDVTCVITDECTGTSTLQEFIFVVVSAPRITSLTGTANLEALVFDPYFDHYLVMHTDEIILTTEALVMDGSLCDAKGINPDLQYLWEELNGSTPAITPEFDPLPVPNDVSYMDFVVPSALNGVEYKFQCTVTDRCNGLTDVESMTLMVIVPPDVELTHVLSGITEITPSLFSERYEVNEGETITIRLTTSPMSSAGFCEARGITMIPPVQYYWENPWNLLELFYEELPETEYTDLLFLVPANAPPDYDVNMYCRVKDLCNELVTEVYVPFTIL